MLTQKPPQWGGRLVLLHEVDDLMAVLALVGSAGDVDPVDATVGGLFDELVVVAVVHDPGESSVKDVGVGEALALLVDKVIHRNADVAGFSKGVLRGIDASDLHVELRTSVAATYYNRLTRELA